MLNIITRPFTEVNGPNKVVSNLVKGLNLIKYPYVINGDMHLCDKIWVPNNLKIIPYLTKVKASIVLGPNLFMTPRGLLPLRNNMNIVYLQPSQWIVDWWRGEKEFQWYLKNIRLAPWPTGIDTREFQDVWCRNAAKPVLIYHKTRDASELAHIEAILEKRCIKYHKIVYGKYQQPEYLQLLKETSFIIWHGCPESQGIALQEALASNIPMIVMDMKALYNPYATRTNIFCNEPHYMKSTCVPYFDDTCGIVSDLERLEMSIDLMMERFPTFQPREYVLNNLSLEKQARSLIEIFETMDAIHGWRQEESGGGYFLGSVFRNQWVWRLFLRILFQYHL